MDFGAMLLRHAMPQEAKYPTIQRMEGLNEEQVAMFKNLFFVELGVPKLEYPTYNFWRIWHYEGGRYTAKRDTWESGFLHGDTAEELAEAIRGYHNRHKSPATEEVPK